MKTVSQNQTWAFNILKSDHLCLANERRTKPYGRARLSPFINILLWTMRIYVLLSFILIIVQIIISLKK